jgi:hypothetical protein
METWIVIIVAVARSQVVLRATIALSAARRCVPSAAGPLTGVPACGFDRQL